ncbi:hypothetical protein BH18ACT14_BH18ACT14_00720 [soil metagenome]
MGFELSRPLAPGEERSLHAVFERRFAGAWDEAVGMRVAFGAIIYEKPVDG